MHEMELFEAEEIWIFCGIIYDRNQTIHNWALEFLIGVGLVWWKLKVGVCQGMNMWSDFCCMPGFILFCVSPLCVFGFWKPAAGNELALQDNCWCAASRLLGAVRCQRFVQCIKVVLVCFQEQCRTIHYIELPSKQITKYNDGNIIMFADL